MGFTPVQLASPPRRVGLTHVKLSDGRFHTDKNIWQLAVGILYRKVQFIIIWFSTHKALR